MNTLYSLSRYARKRISCGKTIVFHSLYGSPCVLSDTEARFYDSISSRIQFKVSNLSMNECDIFHNLHNFGLIVEDPMIEEKVLEKLRVQRRNDIEVHKHLHGISLNITELCNFACTHCLPKKVSFVNDFGKSMTSSMSEEEARKALIDFFAITPSGDVETKQVFFGGREPLVRWNIIKKLLPFIKDLASARGLGVQFIMFTNASLINKEIAQVIKEYDISIFSSIDGLAKTNDIQRRYNNGQGTFDDIVRGWQLLRDIAHPITGASLTLSPVNYNTAISEELFELLEKQHIKALAINIDHTAFWEQAQLLEVEENLKMAMTMVKNHNISLRGQWKKIFENMFENVSNSMRLSFCEAHSGFSITAVSGGGFTLCPSNPEYFYEPSGLLGIMQNQAFIDKVCSRQIGGLMTCSGCDIEGFCGGGCAVTAKAIEDFSGFSQRCDFYKKMFDFQLEEFLIGTEVVQ